MESEQVGMVREVKIVREMFDLAIEIDINSSSSTRKKHAVEVDEMIFRELTAVCVDIPLYPCILYSV